MKTDCATLVAHDYAEIGKQHKNSKGDSVQTIYCKKCGDSKEIVIEGKKKQLLLHLVGLEDFEPLVDGFNRLDECFSFRVACRETKFLP